MTYKLLYICLERIATRKHNNYAAQASLHGLQVKFQQNNNSRLESPQEEILQHAENSALEYLRKKRLKHG